MVGRRGHVRPPGIAQNRVFTQTFGKSGAPPSPPPNKKHGGRALTLTLTLWAWQFPLHCLASDAACPYHV